MALCDGLDINIPLTVPTIVNKFVLLEREGSNEEYEVLSCKIRGSSCNVSMELDKIENLHTCHANLRSQKRPRPCSPLQRLGLAVFHATNSPPRTKTESGRRPESDLEICL